MSYGFRDYVRPGENLAPTDKIVHILRPGVSTLRTLCGLGRNKPGWRITVEGARVHVDGDGWALCVTCCQRTGQPNRDGRDETAKDEA